MTTKGLLGAVEQILDFARDHGHTPHDVLALLGIIIPERVTEPAAPKLPQPVGIEADDGNEDRASGLRPSIEDRASNPTPYQMAVLAYAYWLKQPLSYENHARGIYRDAGMVMPVNSRILSYWLVQNPDAGARIVRQCKQGHLFRRVATRGSR